jgi:hypothetical protein
MDRVFLYVQGSHWIASSDFFAEYLLFRRGKRTRHRAGPFDPDKRCRGGFELLAGDLLRASEEFFDFRTVQIVFGTETRDTPPHFIHFGGTELL